MYDPVQYIFYADIAAVQEELRNRRNPGLANQLLNLVIDHPVEFINHGRAAYLVQVGLLLYQSTAEKLTYLLFRKIE